MFSISTKLSLLYSMILFTAMAHAQSDLSLLNKSVSGELNFELRQACSDRLSIRLSMFESSGLIRKPKKYLSIFAQTMQQTGLLLIDYHPFESSFRGSFGLAIKHHRWNISAGPMVYYQPEDIRFEIDLSELPDSYTVEIDTQRIIERAASLGYDLEADMAAIDSTYTIEGFDRYRAIYSYRIELPYIQINDENVNLQADVDFGRFSPYFGIGWATEPYLSGNIQYNVDIGFIYHGKPSLNLELNGTILESHDLLTQYLHHLVNEKEIELNNDIARYQLMPYISFAMSGRF